jgi:PPOX class probable F420-dependent enzyme
MSPLLAPRAARRILTVAKKPLTAAMDDSAYDVLERPVTHGSFSSLAPHQHCLLVTYKRDGTPVPAPVWFGLDGDRLFVWTEINAYKAKRLGRDERALIAPCGPTGKPLGDPVAAVGRILTTDAERAHAAATLRASWGPARRLFERMSRPVTEVHYLEFVPAATA